MPFKVSIEMLPTYLRMRQSLTDILIIMIVLDNPFQHLKDEVFSRKWSASGCLSIAKKSYHLPVPLTVQYYEEIPSLTGTQTVQHCEEIPRLAGTLTVQ
jgi:hypothetical protein